MEKHLRSFRGPPTTEFRNVLLWKKSRGTKFDLPTYGYTRAGLAALRTVTDAARDGHTVSMREFVVDGNKLFDADIQWEEKT